MKYIKFIIENYRGITGPLEVDVWKNRLLPIIGVNESGKTTILQAIFAFDDYNDDLNEGRHLQDTANLYRTTPLDPTVSAEVQISRQEFLEQLKDVAKTATQKSDSEAAPPSGLDILLSVTAIASYVPTLNTFPTRLTIRRNLKTLQYDIVTEGFPDAKLNHAICTEIVRGLPYILFFDDFRDSVDEKIEIVKDAEGEISGWLSIMQRLFLQTDSSFSVFDLETKEERARKTLLAKVMRKLNSTLTKEWKNFRLDEVDALKIAIDYDEEAVADGSKRKFLKLEIVERDENGDDYHFYIRDRSKGFFWFFNFVMKLEFNPKVVTGMEGKTIYLLDEPGSYLHASAQRKLCSKLRSLSEKNTVIYCTHSHYLLNPEIIPLSSIYVADKSGSGSVGLTPIHSFRGDSTVASRSAFQPVVDALEIKPFLLDLTFEKTVIVEGIYDYYSFEMFKQPQNVNFLPSVNADSIQYYISLMIAWQVKYYALWDNDDAGRYACNKAISTFGAEEANGRFFLLPLRGRAQKQVLQNLYAGDDLRMIKEELNLPSTAAFDKTIAALYFAPNRSEILGKVSRETKDNFSNVLLDMGIG